MLRSTRWCTALALFSLSLAACGGDKKSEGDVNKEAQGACNGSALSEAPQLPKGWPTIAGATYTQQSDQGPTKVVEGYFDGDVKNAHDEFKLELQAAGFTILFDELEEQDSEVSWKGQGRSGQVALREECGGNDKIFVHITNRPA